MNIAVLEDDHADKIRLEDLLNVYSVINNIVLNIDFYPDGETFLVNGRKRKYHLILMDIYMGNLDGIETALLVEKIQEDALIVYLTSSTEDIWRAVGTHCCFDYICKSDLNMMRLDKLFKDIMNRLHITEQKLTFQSGKQEIILKIQDIQYIISRNKYTAIIFKNNQERSYRITFSFLHNLLKDNENFLLCNRGILLNMNFIQHSNGESYVMKDGTTFPLRRNGRKDIVEKYNNFQFYCLDTQEVPE